MSGADGVAPPLRESLAALRVSPDDYWRAAGRVRARRLTAASLLVLLASLAVHGAFIATALLTEPTKPPRAEQETAVEVVSEVPKVAEPATPPDPKATRTADADGAKPPDNPNPPDVKLPDVKPPEVKTADTKPEPPPDKPTADVRPPPAPSPAQADAAAELKALRDELAGLKAETAQLEGEQVAPPAPTASAPRRPDGLGPLPDSFQAVALPSDTKGEGEAVSYAELVFSQLAKAKGFERREGQPGTAGVRFDVDGAGGLVDVAIAVSSGIKALDDEAVAVVRKAAPFPAPPQGAQRSFSANVSFVTQAAR